MTTSNQPHEHRQADADKPPAPTTTAPPTATAHHQQHANTSTYTCRRHGTLRHHFFVNYRVATDASAAETLAFALEAAAPPHGVQGPPTAFRDKNYLQEGEGWELGFVHCLRSSACVVLVISEMALQGVQSADKRADNVLLEYEVAMELAESGRCVLFPVLMGRVVEVQGQGKLYKSFSEFDVSVYPDAPHAHAKSNRTRSVRAIMADLFKLQGRFVQPDQIASVAGEAAAKMAKQWIADAAVEKQLVLQQREEAAAQARRDREAGRAVRAQEVRERVAATRDRYNPGTSSNTEAFLKACNDAQESVALQLLAEGNMDVDATMQNGMTALHACAHHPHDGMKNVGAQVVGGGREPTTALVRPRARVRGARASQARGVRRARQGHGGGRRHDG